MVLFEVFVDEVFETCEDEGNFHSVP